jgi:hypothetical protein
VTTKSTYISLSVQRLSERIVGTNIVTEISNALLFLLIYDDENFNVWTVLNRLQFILYQYAADFSPVNISARPFPISAKLISWKYEIRKTKDLDSQTISSLFFHKKYIFTFHFLLVYVA